MSGLDKKRAFPYYSEVQGFEVQRRRLEDDPSRRGRGTKHRGVEAHSCACGERPLLCRACRIRRPAAQPAGTLPAAHRLAHPASLLQGRGGAAGVAGAGAEHV